MALRLSNVLGLLGEIIHASVLAAAAFLAGILILLVGYSIVMFLWRE